LYNVRSRPDERSGYFCGLKLVEGGHRLLDTVQLEDCDVNKASHGANGKSHGDRMSWLACEHVITLLTAHKPAGEPNNPVHLDPALCLQDTSPASFVSYSRELPSPTGSRPLLYSHGFGQMLPPWPGSLIFFFFFLENKFRD
jgi:hypothetical protein